MYHKMFISNLYKPGILDFLNATESVIHFVYFNKLKNYTPRKLLRNVVSNLQRATFNIYIYLVTDTTRPENCCVQRLPYRRYGTSQSLCTRCGKRHGNWNYLGPAGKKYITAFYIMVLDRAHLYRKNGVKIRALFKFHFFFLANASLTATVIVWLSN